MSAKRVEEKLKEKSRNGIERGPQKMVRPQGEEEGRLEEWRTRYEVAE